MIMSLKKLGKGSQASPGPVDITQSGLRLCLRDQGWKKSTVGPAERKSCIEAPGKGKGLAGAVGSWAGGPEINRGWGKVMERLSGSRASL